MNFTPEGLAALDLADPLAKYRDRFILPEGVLYLDGNSLGPLPRATPARLAEVVTREWGEGLIRSWNDVGWIDEPLRLGEKIGRVIGAEPGSVAVADSTSVNLYKLLGAALMLRPGRQTILTEAGNFPTDLYVAESLAAFRAQGHRVLAVAAEDLAGALGPDVAVMMITHVNYRTGAMHDMAALTAAAHAAGALALWDLAHSAGAVPLGLAADGADLAVGCGYKFLNGGPGAPALLYVAPHLQATARFPIEGWLGHAAPFAFEPTHRPADGIARVLVGTPPILGLASLAEGVTIALEAPIAEVRTKSLRLFEVFAGLVEARCAGFGLRLLTPTDPPRRGSQISFSHPQAWPVMQALIARGVIGDVRAPDILRFGLTPLYLRYADIWDAVETLLDVLATEIWRQPDYQVRKRVM
jgi:kynureninase